MSYKYLPTGQTVIIEEETKEYFFVRPVLNCERQDYDGDYYESEAYGDMIKVAKSELLDKAPTERFDAEITAKKQELQGLQNQLTDKKRELYTVEAKIRTETSTLMNQEKFIINRSELMAAESIAFFGENSINPTVWDKKDKNFRGMKIATEIEIGSGKERNWGYKVYFDWESSSTYLDDEFGIVINPTEEKLIEIALKRQSRKKEFSDHAIKNAHDKYLTETNKQRKAGILEKHKLEEIEKTKKEIEKQRLHLQNLEAKLLLENQ